MNQRQKSSQRIDCDSGHGALKVRIDNEPGIDALSSHKGKVGVLLLIANESEDGSDPVSAMDLHDPFIGSLDGAARNDSPSALAVSESCCGVHTCQQRLSSTIDFVGSKVFSGFVIVKSKHALFPQLMQTPCIVCWTCSRIDPSTLVATHHRAHLWMWARRSILDCCRGHLPSSLLGNRPLSTFCCCFHGGC